MPMREQVNVTLLLNYWELKHNARQILDFLGEREPLILVTKVCGTILCGSTASVPKYSLTAH